ncbi:MAG: hypothetical protein Q8M92_03965 [Candidatus Subteraquimicrobiales bacterium]|nr:hypothetical protein [Candidatus Subteraquimicrobiales bacterium]
MNDAQKCKIMLDFKCEIQKESEYGQIFECPDCKIMSDVHIKFMPEDGLPVCPDCDQDMEYLCLVKYDKEGDKNGKASG